MTILYDNYQHDPNLRTDWGFSCLVEGLEKTILFDTGADGGILLDNMDKLHVDPKDVDVVVLSHEHWDHTGGLLAFLERNSEVTVSAPRSFSASFKEDVTGAGAEYVEVGDSVQVCEHAFSTGEVTGPMMEQALVLETGEGLVVITGCAHPGVVSMVRAAKEARPGEVDLVIGGFHMGEMPDGRVQSVIGDLKALGVKRAAPCHCSGDRARELFEEAYAEDYVEVGVGMKLTVTPAE